MVLSPEAIASSWVALEYSASLYKDPAAANRSLIPILRQDCDIPLTLGRLKHLDARGEDFERQVDHLLNGIERVEVEQTERPHRQLSSMESQEQKQEGKQGDAAPLREGARLLTLGMPVSPSTDSLYIERSVDLQARRSIEDRELLLISGPRRIGKTSLLLRAQAFAASIGRKAAFVDFQMFGAGTSAPELYCSLCLRLAHDLTLQQPVAEEFLRSPGRALASYFHELNPDCRRGPNWDQCLPGVLQPAEASPGFGLPDTSPGVPKWPRRKEGSSTRSRTAIGRGET